MNPDFRIQSSAIKRHCFILLIAHVVGSYSTYLLEFARQYFSDHSTSIVPWVIGAPIFAPIALPWLTITRGIGSALLLQLWGGYLIPTIAMFVLLGGFKVRHAVGLCATCGYDLRATPDRCPECGMAVTVR